jgi:CRP/FNR family transcriptional regulator, cyclic AMP receptor protein
MAYRVRVIPKKKRRVLQSTAALKPGFDLRAMQGVSAGSPGRERIFANLPRRVLSALEAISSAATYPKDAILFIEGQEPRGVYILCSGRVKLSATSADGKSIIVGISEGGEVVGLASAVSGRPCELTAEALDPLQVNFIPREAFLQFLREYGEAAVRVAEILSNIYHSTLLEVRYLGFSSSTAEKLARFLLDLPVIPVPNNGHLQATLTLTHKDIGEMIGAARETVTRLFAHFKREGLIEVHGSNLIFAKRANLAGMLEG